MQFCSILNKSGSSTIILVVFLTMPFSDCLQADELSRLEFHRKLQQVAIGMSREAVAEILGTTDRNISEEVRQNAERLVEWRYGVLAGNNLGTLGTVRFGGDNKVLNILGAISKPDVEHLPPEAELRRMLCAIDRLPGFDGNSFNPFDLVNAANQIHALGQVNAFYVFREYLRIADNDSRAEKNVYLLLRVLHNIPLDERRFPKPQFGAFFPDSTTNLSECPQFPIMFVRDVPLLPVVGCVFSGERQPLIEKLSEFQAIGIWRESALVLSSMAESEVDACLLELEKSESWYFRENQSKYVRRLLRDQLMRFVATRGSP